MSSDPSTQLQCLAALCAVFALGFGVLGRRCGLSPAATGSWSLGNALFAAGTALTVWCADSTSPWLYALADTLELGGFAALWTGFRTFTRSHAQRHELIALPLLIWLAGLGLVAAYAAGELTLRLWIYSALAALLLGLAGAVAVRGLRPEFGRLFSFGIAAPMWLAAGLEALRALASLAGDTQVLQPLANTPFNVGVIWAGYVVALALNLAIAGFVGARQAARVQALTLTDPLTEALNRRAFDRLLARELAAISRHGRPLAIVLFDLDHFKAINDRHGHAAGDAVLRHVGQLTRGLCRHGDALGRLGGEEFCLLLPYTNLEGACLMAERLRSAVSAAPVACNEGMIDVSASLGVAGVEPDRASSAEALLAQADRAMYEAKLAGRDRVVAHAQG